MKKILVLGNGGREHAICKALLDSDKHEVELYGFLSARNPGIVSLCKKYELCFEDNFGEKNNFETLKQFAIKSEVDFAVVGPDDPIGAGATDALLEVGIKSMAPTKSLARLESSKGFTRSLLEKYEIEGNPRFRNFDSIEGVREFCEELEGNFVIKDDGLCGGKGVFVSEDHFDTIEQGMEIVEEIASKGRPFVIEEKLIGVEFSAMYFADGKTIKPMPLVADHKRAFEGDTGPNTGGMGTISYPEILPFVTQENWDEAGKITKEVMFALEKECGTRFKGIMYGGFIRTKNGTKLIEYNARFGDPEVLNVLPLLKADFVDVCEAVIGEKLDKIKIEFEKKATVCKYVVPEGYPTKPEKGAKISVNKDKIPQDVEAFYASIKEEDGYLYLAGSRSIGFVGIADTIEKASEIAEKACQSVSGPVFWRRDIGSQELMDKRLEIVDGF